MKKTIMNKWVKALRSGKYKQCREKLCNVNGQTGEESFCCLGVLTDLYLKDRKQQKKGPGIKNFNTYTKKDMDYEHDFSKWEVDGEEGCLPGEVAKWAGFNTITDDYKTGCFSNGKKEIDLAMLNDGGLNPLDYSKKTPSKSFKQIADVIEKNYEHI
jgi:hypothetical protein